MNSLHHLTKVGTLLAIMLGSASCEKDNLLTPEKVPTDGSGTATNAPGPVTTYTLSRYGNDTLIYDVQGRLQSVIDKPIGGVGNGDHTEYTYKIGAIKAVHMNGLQALRDETYQTDINGRCYELHRVVYSLVNNVPQSTTSDCVFTYDATGHLQSCTDKSNQAKGTSFTFNAAGDMVKAVGLFSMSSTADKTFVYDQPVGAPLQLDRQHINDIGTNQLDFYLQIFGKPSVHLVKLIKVKSVDGYPFLPPYNWSYVYTISVHGNVLKKEKYNGVGGPLIDTKVYNYLISSTPITTM